MNRGDKLLSTVTECCVGLVFQLGTTLQPVLNEWLSTVKPTVTIKVKGHREEKHFGLCALPLIPTCRERETKQLHLASLPPHHCPYTLHYTHQELRIWKIVVSIGLSLINKLSLYGKKYILHLKYYYRIHCTIHLICKTSCQIILIIRA